MTSAVDTEDAPKVTLGGKTFPVVPVAFREASKIVPLVSEVFTSRAVTEASLEGIAKIVFYGLKRGTPDLTLDALLDMPVSIKEMTDAALVVCGQAGLKQGASPGEAPGDKSPLTSAS